MTGIGAGTATNFNPENSEDASANGRGSNGNQYIIDGLDVTSSIRPGAVNLTPNADSVQEASVQTNTYTVDYGRASSIQTVMTTKSGTNTTTALPASITPTRGCRRAESTARQQGRASRRTTPTISPSGSEDPSSRTTSSSSSRATSRISRLAPTAPRCRRMRTRRSSPLPARCNRTAPRSNCSINTNPQSHLPQRPADGGAGFWIADRGLAQHRLWNAQHRQHHLQHARLRSGQLQLQFLQQLQAVKHPHR